MKNLKTKLMLAFGVLFFFTSCDVNYLDSPYQPSESSVSTGSLLNNTVFNLSFSLEDQWLAGRGTLGFAQYWAETFYTTENRYQLRTSQSRDFWEVPYAAAIDLKKIIELNENPETAAGVSALGPNNNQIQISRILLTYCFSRLVDAFGDVPYWSYGQKSNEDFQALDLDGGVVNPKYTSASVIYTDMLKELKEAADALTEDKTFANSDFIYSGDTSKWKKFAHSLRLRLAAHIKNVDNAKATQVFNESETLAFSSNADNATFTFGTDDNTGGPWHDHFTVSARRDFGPSFNFVELLKNNMGPASAITDEDPRLTKYFDPRTYTNDQDKTVPTPTIVGLPYGLGNNPARDILLESKPSATIIKPDYTHYFIDYAEVEFIRSEFKNWDATNYENGVKASMQRWGVDETSMNAYFTNLPAADEDNVRTQKYIALYMNGMEAWTEYRRTGYPTTLWKPGSSYGFTFLSQKTDKTLETKTVAPAPFTPLITGLTDIPNRVAYPQKEQLLNDANRKAASSNYTNGDKMNSSIFWDK